jgi:putative membrane protein
MCRAIEISLRESVQDEDVPPPMQAVDFLLH